MEYYFNEVKYDSLITLQDRYTKFLKSKDNTFYLKIVDDEGEIILDRKFIKNNKYKLLPLFLHHTIQCELIDHLNDIYISSVLEDLLNAVDDMYIDLYTKINQTDELECLKVHTEEYTDYISTSELIFMAEQCALYDLDNHLSTKSFDMLTEEYYHLSTECLIEEYEKIYEHDYHLRHIDKIICNHDDLKIKEIANKNKNKYSAMKNHALKNNIVFERKIKQ